MIRNLLSQMYFTAPIHSRNQLAEIITSYTTMSIITIVIITLVLTNFFHYTINTKGPDSMKNDVKENYFHVIFLNIDSISFQKFESNSLNLTIIPLLQESSDTQWNHRNWPKHIDNELKMLRNYLETYSDLTFFKSDFRLLGF